MCPGRQPELIPDPCFPKAQMSRQSIFGLKGCSRELPHDKCWRKKPNLAINSRISLAPRLTGSYLELWVSWVIKMITLNRKGTIVRVSTTVVIPTFERPESTARAVESVLNQTSRPEAIVVVDDGSSELARSSLEKYLSRLPVTFLWQPHCGHPGRVRNVGLRQVTTTHVAFLDSDDLWVQDKLEVQADMARQGARAQGSSYELEAACPDTQVERKSLSMKHLSLRDLLKGNELCNSSVLVEMDLLREVGGLATSYAVRGIEDYATWLRVATRAQWIFSDTPLVVYSDSPATSMRSTNEFSITERTLALWDLAWWLSSQGKEVPMSVRLAMRGSDLFLRNWAARQGPDV